MRIVDADTHVDETERTWMYGQDDEAGYMPSTLTPPAAQSFVPGDARPHQLWMYAGEFRLRRHRDDARTSTTKATRELLDVPARLRQMDDLGVDVQVLYPTFFLTSPSARPEVELALCRSYNRWLAELTREAHGRLRWVAMLPLMSIDRAIEEIRFARENGACGLLKKGIECGDRVASDPYFHAVYEEAERADLPICIHTGNGDPGKPDTTATFRTAPQRVSLPVLAAFSSLVIDGVPDLFPRLRFGFIEAGASWIPYLIHDLQAKATRQNSIKLNLREDLLRASRFYVTCDTLDDLPYILSYGAEDNLMVGSDYGHADQSAEIDAPRNILRMAEAGRISPHIAEKIVDTNARRFYGL
ncbi:MAG: amidohydrolase family protein [Chloroflexota bacterium]